MNVFDSPQKIYLAIGMTFSICTITSTSNVDKDLPYPFNTVTVLPFDGSGHFGEVQADGLSYLINKYKPNIVVEIGSYLGASTRYIAKLLPAEGIVYAIDHWLGNEEWKNQPNFNEKQSLFYQKFLSNIIHEKLYHKIIPIKMSSLEAAKKISCTPDLVFIDGSHDYQSVYEDICAWYNPHGILCGDDYSWGESKSVKRAVDRFAEENNLKVKLIKDWFWYYEKK